MKRLLLILVAIFLITSTVSAQAPAPITGTPTVCIGNTTLLSDATPSGTWSSSNPAVAFVNPATGLVSGISAGLATITYTVGTYYVTASVAVRGIPVLTPDSVVACVGSTHYLTPNPSGGGWTSSNPAIATVNYAGAVTGVAPGTTTVVYTSAGGCVKAAAVTVNAVPLPITGVGFVYSGTTTLLSDITPGGSWFTSDPSLATVNISTGVVTGVSSGLVLVSYTIPSTGCSAVYRVDVNPLPGTTNLYSWYPFCGDTTDQSLPTGGGPHPLFMNPAGAFPTLTTDRYGVTNSAYNFSGGNCFMQFSTFFPLTGIPPDFTYSCWINPSVPQSSIIWYNGNPNSDGFGVVMNDGTGFPGGPGSSISVLFGGIGQFATTPLPAPVFSWHNLVIVKNGGSYHLYIDNNFPGSFFISPFNPMSAGSFFAIGGNASGAPLAPLGFIGDIDDVAAINKQLSPIERTSLFNFNPDAKQFELNNTEDTTICSDFIRLAPNPQTVGGAYTWTTFVTGSGYVVTDTLDTAIVVYPLPGIMGNSYALTVSKPYGCNARDTIGVYKNPIPVNIGAPVEYFCKGDTVTLTSYFPGSSFLWSTGDTAHTIKVTTTGTYYLTVDSIIHLGPGDSATCVGRDTAYIQFSRVPIITAPATVINCVGNPATVYTLFDPGYTYLWSTGSLGDSTNLAASGTYWVRVTDSGCIRYDTGYAVIIDERVTLMNHDTAVCFPDIVQATASVNPTVTYQWTPTAGIPASNLPSVTIHPDTSAEYYLIVSFPGCPNIIDSFHVDVQHAPVVSIGGNKDVCEGDTLHITAKVTPSWYRHYSYIWKPVNADLDSTDTSIVIFHAITRHDSEELIVKVYPPVYLTNGADSMCYGMDSAAIFVHPRFFVRYDTSFKLCPGDSIQFNPIDTSTVTGMAIASYHWTPGLYLDDSLGNMPWLHPITSQNYRMIATSIYGCADTQYVNIVVHPAAVINLGDSVILQPGQSYHIQPQTNCVTFEWFPPYNIDNYSASDPVVTPPANTTYIVHAATEDGCLITDSLRIHVDPGTLIWIPNAFTPDGNINNMFTIIKRGFVGLNYFRIFDRWGNKVYESKNIDAGWDGNFNGKPQPYGVYVYDVEAVTSTGVIFHREGNVTLIR